MKERHSLRGAYGRVVYMSVSVILASIPCRVCFYPSYEVRIAMGWASSLLTCWAATIVCD